MASQAASLPVPAARAVSLPRLGLLFAHLFVLGYIGVLAGGFVVQFGEAEMPCPLCVLQRMGMMLCALGPVTIIQRSRQGTVTAQDFAMGYGIAVVGAIVGAAIAVRQILLHIVPPDPGYGSEVLGLHLYTWALVTFVVAAACSGIMLMLTHRVVPGDERMEPLSTITIWMFGAVVAANAVVVFVEEGFNWVLPDDPARYELLYQLGIR